VRPTKKGPRLKFHLNEPARSLFLNRVNAWEGITVVLLVIAAVMASFRIAVWRRLLGSFQKNRESVESGSGDADNSALLWPESWLAVRSRNLASVQMALSLHQPKPCSWLEGFTNADSLFIAPPVKGWVLVTGAGLPEPLQDVDACFRFVLDLSRKLGHVQFFSANRTLLSHAWVRAENGRIVRGYAWAGTTQWQQGVMTLDEMELGLYCFDYAEPAACGWADHPEFFQNNVQKVGLLAARWGLDPARVRKHLFLNESGVAGKAAHRY